MRYSLSVLCVLSSLLLATASFGEGEADDTASESGRAVSAGTPVGTGGAGVSTIGHQQHGSHGTRKNHGNHNLHSNHHQNHGHQVHVSHANGPAIVPSATPHPSGNPQAHSQTSTQQSFAVVNPGGHVLTGNGATHGNAWWKHPQALTSGVTTGSTSSATTHSAVVSHGSGLTPATQSPQTPTGVITPSYQVPTLAPYQVPTPTPYQVPNQVPTATPYQVPTPTPYQVPAQTPYQVPNQVPTATPYKVPQLTPAQTQKIKQMGVNFQKQIIVVGHGTVATNVPHQLILTPQQIILVPQYNSYYHHPNYNPYVSVYHNFDGRTYLYNNAIPFTDTNFHLIVAGVREPTPKELVNYHPDCESGCERRRANNHRIYK